MRENIEEEHSYFGAKGAHPCCGGNGVTLPSNGTDDIDRIFESKIVRAGGDESSHVPLS